MLIACVKLLFEHQKKYISNSFTSDLLSISYLTCLLDVCSVSVPTEYRE
jgi:hypothetical protein